MAHVAKKAPRPPRRMSIIALSAALAQIIAISAVLPTARPARLDAPAASFAVAGLIGAVGDVSGVSDADLFMAQDATRSGTLAFGDPSDPPPPAGGHAPPVPPVDAPPVEPASDEIVHAPEQPAHPAPPAEEVPAETTPAPVAAPAEVAPAAPAEAAPAPAAPAEAAPAPAPVEAAPAPAPAAPSDNVAERGLRASQIVRTLVGRAYRYGAAGPGAFDCSGLTLYVYKQLGITLPHKARIQFNTRYGKLIPSMKDLMPGDLVYFKNTAGPGITHAAIYVGDGKMVGASSPRTGVHISSIDDAYWRKHWAGGIRPGG